MAKLHFFGTSHGVPSETRYCSSLLLETDSGVYLFDAGAPVTDRMIRRGISFDRLRAVFLTHFHGDHVLGVLPLLSLSNWHELSASYTTFFPEKADAETVRELLLRCDDRMEFGAERLPYRILGKGPVYEDEEVLVSAMPNAHRAGRATFSFCVDLKKNGKRLVLTGDMHPDLIDFPIPDGAPADLIVSECAHCSAQKLLSCLTQSKTKAAAVTHIYPLPEKTELFLGCKDSLPFNLLIPEDGDVLTL